MTDMTDSERRERFRLAYEELKQSMERLPTVAGNEERLELWHVILTRQSEIEELYPARVDAEERRQTPPIS
jgi:hypothetical protein